MLVLFQLFYFFLSFFLSLCSPSILSLSTLSILRASWWVWRAHDYENFCYYSVVS